MNAYFTGIIYKSRIQNKNANVPATKTKVVYVNNIS